MPRRAPPPNNETRAPGSPPPRRTPSYQGRPAAAQPGPGGGGAEWHIAGARPPRAARSRAASPAPLPGRGSHGRAPPLARSRPARRPPPGKVLGSGNKAWLGRELFSRSLRAHSPSSFFFLWLSVGAPEPSICLPFGLGPGSPIRQPLPPRSSSATVLQPQGNLEVEIRGRGARSNGATWAAHLSVCGGLFGWPLEGSSLGGLSGG